MFNEWESFYLIVGTAAGALIGLQFVVITLIANKPDRPSAGVVGAYATPTIIHFSAALLLSALIRAPFQTITPAAFLWGLIGLIGVAYIVIVARRMRVQTPTYTPKSKDWLFNVLLPLVTYAILALSTVAAYSYPREAQFGVGASTLLLLFIGIHNAWGAIMYHAFGEGEESAGAGKGDADDENESTD